MENTNRSYEKEHIVGEDIITIDNVKQYAAMFQPNLIITNDIASFLIESLSEYLDNLISLSVKMTKHRKGLYVQKKDVVEGLKKRSTLVVLDDISDDWY
uniref:Transcription initiation factor TFIID subunit 12 n=1 Tax=Strongyloides venezuelensis TaxID=75913 RepID=A0A0K0EUF5_STRVS